MIVIGSRGSKLALWQANGRRAARRSLGSECRIEIIRTTRGQDYRVAPEEGGNKGLFTKETRGGADRQENRRRRAQPERHADRLPAGLVTAAIPEREDSRDAMIGRRWSICPRGARIGTGSLRRAAQLRAVRPDLISAIFAAISTRACASWTKVSTKPSCWPRPDCAGSAGPTASRNISSTEIMCPAVGQGALAIETRADDGERAACSKLEHLRYTRRGIGGARNARFARRWLPVPIGANATVRTGPLSGAVVISPEGDPRSRRGHGRDERRGSARPETLGQELIRTAGARFSRRSTDQRAPANPTLT